MKEGNGNSIAKKSVDPGHSERKLFVAIGVLKKKKKKTDFYIHIYIYICLFLSIFCVCI